MSKKRKGKLRTQDPVALGKQYAGARLSRDALDTDSDGDPFAAHTDDDQSSVEDAESGEEDEDDLDDVEVSGSEALEINSEESDSPGSSAESDDEDNDEEGDDDPDEDDEEDELDDDSSDAEESAVPRRIPKKSTNGVRHSDHGTKQAVGDDREELRRLMASDQKAIAATISQAAKADAAKGKAVKEQRTTFDALLNTRIKLQKGLSAINEIEVVSGAGAVDFQLGTIGPHAKHAASVNLGRAAVDVALGAVDSLVAGRHVEKAVHAQADV